MCFYIRPEHVPNANFAAMYLAEPTFPSLLSGISSTLQVHVRTIDTIYYYDHQMSPVVVNEQSIKSLLHEQELIVRLLWEPNHTLACHVETDHQNSLTRNVQNGFTDLHLNGAYASTTRPVVQRNHTNMFDQYLPLPHEASHGTCVDNWSDRTAQCSNDWTTASSEDGLHSHEDHYQHQLALAGQGLDQASYSIDAVTNASALKMCLSSAPEADILQLSTPIHVPLQIYRSQPEYLRLPATEEQLAPEALHEIQELMANKLLPSRSASPSSLNFSAKRPDSLQKCRAPSSIKSSNIDGELRAIDKNVAGALERNRLAAMKCRLTRKEKEKRLQKLTREKSEHNAQLKQEVKRLQAQVMEAKGLLDKHVECA